MVRKAALIIQIAESKIGLHEAPRGSNDGPELREFLKGSGFRPGQYWCLYFAITCVAKAFGGWMRLPHTILMTGSCQEAADWAREHHGLSVDAATGAIFVLANAQGHFHHAGIVSRVDIAAGRIETIEGNSNDDGSRNGWEVVRHSRPIHSVKYIVWE